MGKTTTKSVMIKKLNAHVCDRLELCAEYFNELANGYYFEYEEVSYDDKRKCYVENDKSEDKTYSTIDDFCNEIAYWLSCYYEGGNCRNEKEEFKDRKAFIKFLEVFKPYCKEKINTKWIPYLEETKFLFD